MGPGSCKESAGSTGTDVPPAASTRRSMATRPASSWRSPLPACSILFCSWQLWATGPPNIAPPHRSGKGRRDQALENLDPSQKFPRSRGARIIQQPRPKGAPPRRSRPGVRTAAGLRGQRALARDRGPPREAADPCPSPPRMSEWTRSSAARAPARTDRYATALPLTDRSTRGTTIALTPHPVTPPPMRARERRR